MKEVEEARDYVHREHANNDAKGNEQSVGETHRSREAGKAALATPGLSHHPPSEKKLVLKRGAIGASSSKSSYVSLPLS